jgi:hypothetical protein
MKERIKNLNYKKLLYTFLFFFLAVINWKTRTADWKTGQYEIYRNLIGVVFALIIMSHYKLEDYKSKKRIVAYVINAFLCAIASPFIFMFQAQREMHVNHPVENAIICLIVFMYAHIIMHTFIQIKIDKRIPNLNWKFFAVFVGMFVWMVVSRSDETWPACYGVMFTLLLLTDFTEKEWNEICDSSASGVILSLFILQGLALLYRHYDYNTRYQGLFNNPNINALYYCVVVAACLYKYIISIESKRKLLIIFYSLTLCGTLSLLFFTISRTGYITAIVATLFALTLLGLRNKSLRLFMMSGIALLITTICLVPLTYMTIRYIPAVSGRIWYNPGEVWEEKIQHSDSWDSEKYISWDEFISGALGRFSTAPKVKTSEPSSNSKLNGINLTNILSGAKNNNDTSSSNEEMVFDEAHNQRELESYLSMGVTKEAYDRALFKSNGEFKSPRIEIYKYYFSHLNLLGHPKAEQGFQLIPTNWIGHAHNIFLQYASSFGIFILPLVLLFAIHSVLKAIVSSKKETLLSALYILVCLIFGMFELSWEPTLLAHILLYFSFCRFATSNP